MLKAKDLSYRCRKGQFDCDPVGIRTRDPLIKSQMLYRLSYKIYREIDCKK
jgi:hypothetical protein